MTDPTESDPPYLTKHTSLTLPPPHTNTQLKSRHIAAIYLYFLSFGPHALEGPRPKKADLRRHQSAQIMVMLSRPSSAVALADDAADDGAGGAGIMMLNLDLADVLAGGGDSGGGDAELEAAAAAAAALQDSGSSSLSSPSSFSSLGDSSNSSAGSSGSGGKKEKGAKEPSLLPRTFRTTITRIIRRRRRTRLSSTSSSSAASLSPSLPSEPLSGHGGRAGSRSSGRLAAVSEEAVKRTSSNSTETIAAVEPSGPGKDGAWATAWTAAAGGIATTESVVTTMTTVNSTAAFATTTRRSSRAALCDAGLPAPALAPALCHHHFVPYKAPAESRNHFRWLLRATKAGDCYHEVEVGQFPLMARATDAEMRELMECGYAYKQHNGHLFLRVSRAW